MSILCFLPPYFESIYILLALTFNQAASQNLITMIISKKKALDEVIESHQTSFKAGLVKLKKMAAHSDNIKMGDIHQLMKADQVIQNIY
ncbi:hypothetical protein [Candidatus Regiella insecticola]|uniref:Uncharacterized protein n=1 Tax=Candidatus Regiella insecticola TaxID=138073 RepID=A0A6L2ZQC1_9ENTR|nr:hypothetical protein [Candidatus Regiella insecticola]GFN46742.1 hypothetical protein RINTU1_24760 [Candidatus Regiella insecticola]